MPPDIQDRLRGLIADIPYGAIRLIEDLGAPDVAMWNTDITQHMGKDWLEPPWFFSEHYFYRRVIEAIGYFQTAGGEGIDPFAFQKQQGLEVNREAILELVSRAEEWKRGADFEVETLIWLLYVDLWGNQADLSMWPAEGESKPDHSDLDHANDFLLANQIEDVVDYLSTVSKKSKGLEFLRFDFLIDNAGFELVCDLILADYILSCELVDQVRFHVKPHPTYVSDAMVKDVVNTINYFMTDKNLQLNQLGSRMMEYLDDERLQIRDNYFWTSPLPAWDLPIPLKRELSSAKMVISKGDANYRRLLGDLDWPYTTPFADVLAYFPAPILALRTVKAEIICGLQAGQAAFVQETDPNWMINGRWGVLQFANPIFANP